MSSGNDPHHEDEVSSSAGFMKYYGLFWRKEWILDDQSPCIIAGRPSGWIGKGKIAKNFDRSAMWVNFAGQKGVYVLYDSDLIPVYAGQAGLIRKGGDGAGRNLGDRLTSHKNGKYRNGWEYFSWFGFLETPKVSEIKKSIRKDDEDSVKLKSDPGWLPFEKTGNPEFNDLLDSFEAVLIEAFTPKFNARGGNLKGATYVDQLESLPFFLKLMSSD